MTAEEKFYKRAEELGIESFAHTRFGHYGVETEDGVVVLVHEDNDDCFDEYHYPSMKELSEDADMRDKIFDAYDSIEDFDKETIGALYLWKILGVYDDYPYPEEAGYSGVYFACEPTESINFSDDEDEYEAYYECHVRIDVPITAGSESEAAEMAGKIIREKLGSIKDEEMYDTEMNVRNVRTGFVKRIY